MTQSDLNRAVARATGETVDRIERMGFQLAEMPISGKPWAEDLHLDLAYRDSLDGARDLVASSSAPHSLR